MNKNNINKLSVSIVHKRVHVPDCEGQCDYIESFIELKQGNRIISSNKIPSKNEATYNDEA